MISLMSQTDTRHYAEVGSLLIAIAGVWLVVCELPLLKLAPLRRAITGLILAAGGVVWIIALRSGNPI